MTNQVPKDDIREKMTAMIREALRSPTQSTLDRWESAVMTFAKEAADYVASKTGDEAKIEELAKSAREGATFAAISREIDQLAKEMGKEAMPLIMPFVDEFGRLMGEATSEAIRQLVMERVAKLLAEQ